VVPERRSPSYPTNTLAGKNLSEVKLLLYSMFLTMEKKSNNSVNSDAVSLLDVKKKTTTLD
jgi:hypothetical protein